MIIVMIRFSFYCLRFFNKRKIIWLLMRAFYKSFMKMINMILKFLDKMI